MSRWFRHYAGMMRDEKLVAVALCAKQPIERVVWIWGAILESAAEINDGGRFDFDADEAAHFLHIDVTECNVTVTALRNKDRVTGNKITNWNKRQWKSDDSTDRVRKHREAKKSNKNNSSETVERNDYETLRNGPETETETETDKNKKELELCSSEQPVEIACETSEVSDWPKDYREQFWAKYPRKQSKKPAFKALDRIRKSGEVEFFKLMAGIEKIPIGDPQFVPHPATWLNAARWDDEVIPGGVNGSGRPRPLQDDSHNVIAAADKLIERLADFNRPAPNFGGTGELRGGTGEAPVRLISKG